MQRKCLQWSEDLSMLLFDQKTGFSDVDIHKDNLYNALFQIQNDELDRLMLVTLEIVMGYFCLTVARNPVLPHWAWKVQYYLKQTKLTHGLMVWILLRKICIGHGL